MIGTTSAVISTDKAQTMVSVEYLGGIYFEGKHLTNDYAIEEMRVGSMIIVHPNSSAGMCILSGDVEKVMEFQQNHEMYVALIVNGDCSVDWS